VPLPYLSDCITTQEASERLGVTIDHISLLLRTGKLKGVNLQYRWYVLKSSLDQYSAHRPKRGPKPKRKTRA